MKARRLRHAAELGAYLAALGAVRALPHTAARAVGGGLGALAYRLDKRHRTVALDNVAMALPDLGESRRRSLVRDCYRHFFGLVCDSLSVTRFDAAGVCRLIRLTGWENLLRAEEEGRGVLLLTAHLGSFEILAHPVALYRGPAHVIARPSDNRALDRRLRGLRERFGNVTIPRRGAGRTTLRALRQGGRVFILADQRVHPHEGIEVPLFGRAAMTSTLTARLSIRCGSPVVPIFCYPEPRGRFRVEALPPIRPEGSGPEAVARLTTAYVEVTEGEIRKHPEMWLWMHNRWRQRR